MITLTEQELKDVLNYLGDLPAKYANPLITFFNAKIETPKEKDLEVKQE